MDIIFRPYIVYFIKNQNLINKLQTYKGLLFIICTGIIFYYIIHRVMDKLRSNNLEIHQQYEEVSKANQEISALYYDLKEANKQVHKVASNFEKLIDLVLGIKELDTQREDVFLSKLLKTAIQLIPEADYGSIYTFNDGKIHFIDAIGHDREILNKLKIDENIFNKTDKKINVVNNIDDYTTSLIKDEKEISLFKKATRPIKQSLTFGLFDKEKRVAGISLDISRESQYTFNNKSIRTMKAFKNLASAFYTMTRYKILQGKFQSDVIFSLLSMLEIHDIYTIGHSQNVAKLSRDIALEMKLSDDLANKTYLAGLVHDVGKTLIPDYILNKKGRLSEEEYKAINKHPVWGYEILRNSEELKEIAKYVLYHHERWDARGYPEGLQGEEIPLISRIISVADAWDAMCSRRAYRDALSIDKALKEIAENSGNQFCPQISGLFLKMVNEEKGKFVQPSNT